MIMDLSYQVYNPTGQLVMQASESCRYSRQQETLLLANGYTLKLNGRKITKAEVRRDLSSKGGNSESDTRTGGG